VGNLGKRVNFVREGDGAEEMRFGLGLSATGRRVISILISILLKVMSLFQPSVIRDIFDDIGRRIEGSNGVKPTI